MSSPSTRSQSPASEDSWSSQASPGASDSESSNEWWWDNKPKDEGQNRRKTQNSSSSEEAKSNAKPRPKDKIKSKSKSKSKASAESRKQSPKPGPDSDPTKATTRPYKQFLRTDNGPQQAKDDHEAEVESRRQKQKAKEERHAEKREKKARRAHETRQRQQAKAAEEELRHPKPTPTSRPSAVYTYAEFVAFCGTESARQALARKAFGAEYDNLHLARQAFHANPESRLFPKPEVYGVCTQNKCMRADTLRCCHHDLERTLHGSGKFSSAWLKKERLLWHPDKFVGKGDSCAQAADMFKMIQRMIDGPSGLRSA